MSEEWDYNCYLYEFDPEHPEYCEGCRWLPKCEEMWELEQEEEEWQIQLEEMDDC
jgi:hypothetical protein